MAHIVLKSDSEGQIVDLVHYCSDTCAKTDEDYAGWYGAHEIPREETKPILCAYCETRLN